MKSSVVVVETKIRAAIQLLSWFHNSRSRGNSGLCGAAKVATLACALIVGGSLQAQTVAATIPAGSRPYAVAVNPVTNKVYVANLGQSNQPSTVTVIDPKNHNSTATVSVGTNPGAIAVNPVTNKVYVANSASNNVTIIDGTTNATTTVSVGMLPLAVAVNTVTNKVYVANGGQSGQLSTVTVIDPENNNATLTVNVGTSPVAIAVDAVTNKIYVANGGSDDVTVIDGATYTTKQVSTGASGPIAVAVNPATNKVYVANFSSNNVTVIDGVTSATSTVSTGAYPRGIAVNPMTNKVYVAGSISNNVTVIDGATNATATVQTDVAPLAVAVNSVTNKVYVAGNGGNVTVIDGTTNTPTLVNTGANNLFAVAVNPVTNKVYVANENSPGLVIVIDGAVNVTSTVNVVTLPYALALNSVTNKVYVANNNSPGLVTVIDGANNSSTSTVMVGSDPNSLAVNPVTNKIYITNRAANTVTVIDSANNNATSTAPAGNNPGAVAVNPVTNKVYVANGGGNGTVTVIDGATNTTSTVAAGTSPFAIAVNQVTNKVYVVNHVSNDVTVIDGATNATSTVNVGSLPSGVAVNPTTNMVYVANYSSGTVTVIDGASNAATEVTAGMGAQAVAVNIVTNKIYVASDSGILTVIDGQTNTVQATLPVGPNSTSVDVNPVTNTIYVSSSGGGTVSVIDGASNTIFQRVTAPGPTQVLTNPTTNQVYVADPNNNLVTVIDVDGHQTVPLNTIVAGVLDADTVSTTNVFQTMNQTPSFTAIVTDALIPNAPTPTSVYYQVDGGSSVWAHVNPASFANPATFNFSLPITQVGLHTLYVYATYGNEGSSSSASEGTGNSPEIGNLTAVTFLIVPIPTKTTVASDTNPQLVGQNVTFTATVTPSISGSAPTGTVAFFDGGTRLGTAPLNPVSGSYRASFQTNSLTTPGSHMITASYSGDNSYSVSSGTMMQTITGPATIVASGGGNQIAVYGASFANPLVVIVKDNDGVPLPGVTVTFSGSGLRFSNSPRVVTDSNGQAQVNATPSIAGSLTASAAVSGVTSPATFVLTASKAALTVTADNKTRPYDQPNATLTSTMTGFVNGDTSSVISGTAVLTTTAALISPAGMYPITMAQGSLIAANYSFTFVNGSLMVTKATPGSSGVSAVTVASSLNPSADGQSVSFTATVPSGATGTTVFMDGTTVVCNGVALSNSTANCTTSTLAAGTHPITMVYSGDSNYNGATSASLSQVINKATLGSTAVTLTSSSNPSGYGQSVTFAATVASGATGTVTFMDGSVSLGTGTVSGGKTTLATAGLMAGTHLITAVYSGDSNYNKATSASLSQVITLLTPAVTISLSATSITSTQGLTVTVVVIGVSGSPIPSGSVTLSSGSYSSVATSLGTGGSATISIPAESLAPGLDTLIVSYAGDGNYRPATASASVLITTLDTPTPSFSPVGGTYSSAQTVKISNTMNGATIYYTTNGTTPTTSSAIYISPITVSASETVKAIAVANGYNASAIGSASYTISSGSTGGAQGAYFGSTSNGEPFETIILPNNKFYALYGTTSGNIFTIMGMITGQGSSTNGTYSAPFIDYYYNGATYSGSVSASYVAGTRISGNIFDSGAGTSSFTGSALPTSQYNFNGPASLSTIVGAWNGALFGGVGAAVNISSNGTFTGSGQGCSYSGSFSPDPSGMNFFNFSLSYGGSPCLLPYQTQTGIAIDYLLSDGVTRQLLAGVSSGSSGNVFLANRTGGSASATYSLSATSPIVAHGSSGTTNVTVSSTSGYNGTIALSCTLTSSPTGAQDQPTCQGNPTVNLSSNTASGVATFTVNTTGAMSAMALPQPASGKGLGGAGSGAVLAVVVLFWVPRGRNVWRSMLGIALAITIIGGMTACGGGGNGSGATSGTSTTNPGTTAGTYTFTVSGTGNDSAKTKATTTFTLSVN